MARLIQKDGEDGYFHGKWARGGPEIVNNLGCADCHNTASPEFAKGKPELTLSRPYAARAMEAIGKPFESRTFRPAIDGLRSVPCGVLLRRQKQSG